MKLAPHSTNSAVRSHRLLLALVCLPALYVLAATPAWWTDRQVLDSNAAKNDYGPANQGQLKNIATKAYAELQARLSASIWSTPEGQALDALISSWDPAQDDNYVPINQGQLKAVAKKFYDVLIQAGYTSAYPWTATTTDDANYAPATVGQVKNLFAFDISDNPTDSDGNGLPDDWEIANFGHIGVDPNTDPDGDGFTTLQEYQSSTNPLDYYNGEMPILEVVSGDNQSGVSDTFLPQPFVARAKTSAGLLLENAPVTFHVTSGGGQLGVNASETVADPYLARTDADGLVAIYFKTPAENSAGSAISATCSTAGQDVSVVFNAFASSLTLIPAALNVQLAPSATGEEILTLSNSGGTVSGFCLEPQNNKAPVATYGYLDSDQAGGPAYEWNDIGATGTLLDLVSDADDAYESLDLFFAFPYFGQSFTKVFVGSNGFITFGQGSNQDKNYELPSIRMPSNEIAPYHTDLSTWDSGDIFYQNEATRTIIQFDNVARLDGHGNATFQIILNNDGMVQFLYKDVPAVSDHVTVGLQNGAKNEGLTISYATPYLHPNLAITLFPAFRDEEWFQVSPLTGSIMPGQPWYISVAFDATRLVGGVYHGALELKADCSGQPLAVIPITMTLNAPPNVTLTSPASGGSVLDTGSVVISAEADDPDGTVTKVQLLADGQVLFEALSPPFQYLWQHPAPGTHVLSAVAFDNIGASTTSGEQTITSLADSDHDGQSDEWELAEFGNLDQSGSGDFDGDGTSNADEYANGSDPTDFYNGVTPVLKLVSGDHQLGFAGNYLSAPIVVEINDRTGQPIQNAPLAFTITGGHGTLADPGTPTDLAPNITLRSAPDGRVSVVLFAPADSTEHVILASTGNGANRLVISETTVVDSSSEPPASPDNLSVEARSPQTSMLTWVDNSSSESGFIIERLDGISWVTAGAVLANITSFHDAAPAAGVTYSYRVQAINAPGGSNWSNTATSQKWLPPIYIVEDLGPISSSPPATTINNLGQTGGLINDTGETVVVSGTNTVTASLWKDGQQVYDYGVIGGLHSSVACVNSAEEIAGYTTHTDGASYVIHAYKGSYLNASDVWVDRGVVNYDNFDQILNIDINFSPGAVFRGNWTRLDVWLLLSQGSNLSLLDRNGQPVRVQWVDVGTATYNQNVGEAFTVKKDGAINHLGVAAGTLSISNQSRATKLNDLGAVVGLSGSGSFIWSEGQPMQTLGTSLALSINNAGQIVGEQTRDGQVWPRFPELIDNNRVTFLPVLPGYQNTGGTAWGINNSGLIVGASGDTYGEFWNATASLWVDGTAINLNTLLPSGSGWQLSQAYDINDQGWIVGRGFKAGDPFAHYFRLRTPELMVDANRDGQMSFTDPAIHGADQTSADKSYRLWLNDDDDTQLDPNTAEPTEADKVPATFPDYSKHQIISKRNLEDFARMWINLGDLEGRLTSGEIQVGLRWKAVQSAAPTINIFPSEDGEGSTGYLTDEAAAGRQIAGVFNNAVTDKTNKQTIDQNGTFVFKPDYWNGLNSENPKKCLLFEGSGEGKGELEIVFLDQSGKEIGEGGRVWLDVKNIKKIYQRYDASGNNQWPSVTFEPDPSESDQTIIFVHGWNQSPDGSSSFAETVYKRLWHRGFKGRFAAMRWNTDWSSTFNNVPLIGQTLDAYLADYNGSEHEAWLAGEALKSFVSSLPGNAKNIVAHSMGNVVVGSALRHAMTVDNYALLHAAVPASCYDTGLYLEQSQAPGAFGYTYWGTRTPDDDPGPLTSALAYRGRLAAVQGNLVNFYLPQDRATTYAWEFNNRVFKPYSGFFYDRSEVDGSKLWKNEFGIRRPLTDPEEAMPYADQAWSKLVGAESRTAGVISSSIDLSNGVYSLPGSTEGFKDDHSAEFNRRIQQVQPFYHELLRQLGVFQNQ